MIRVNDREPINECFVMTERNITLTVNGVTVVIDKDNALELANELILASESIDENEEE